MPSLKPDCEFALQRKTGTKSPSPPSSPFSAVRFGEELSRKMGMFRVFRGNGRRNLSAVKTCWRRKCDSNSHYRFESRNPRRLRNLQMINKLTRELTAGYGAESPRNSPSLSPSFEANGIR